MIEMHNDILRKEWFRKASSILLLAAILLYPICIYALKLHIEISYIFTSFLFVLPILVIALLLPKRWLYCVLVVLLTIISIIELTMVDLYGEFLMPGGVISTLRTDNQEASEFVTTNISEILRWTPIMLMCVGACWLYERPRISNRKWIVYIMVMILPIGFVRYKLWWYNSEITLRYYLDNRVWNRPPYNILYASLSAHKILKQRQQIANAEQMSFGAHRKSEPLFKEIYVLAIGESLRYDNVSLNGKYARQTTPRLEKLDNIVLFDDYYAQACLTMFSVPMLITRATPTHFELNYSERSIVEPFRECGFSTYVIVNNNLLSYETYLSAGADSLIAINNVVENQEIVSGDKTIVQIIDSLARWHDKLFVMCQFKGSHSFYTNYESDFDIYHPNSNDAGVSFSKETLTNAYDNTILYTDYILSSIIEILDKDSVCSALMFMSDHGERISDGGGGHGGNCSPTRDEYHVPLIYWWSDNYAATFPEKVQAASMHKKTKINGDVVFYSACGMADIEIDSVYAQPTWDILSPDFQEHERLILVPDGVSTINPDK